MLPHIGQDTITDEGEKFAAYLTRHENDINVLQPKGYKEQRFSITV